MVSRRWVTCGSASTGICGIIFVILGIALPIIINEAIETGLKGSWMKASKYSHWGETPGHYDMNVTRGFTLFNVSNPNEILLGDKPRLVEIGPYPFREISQFADWEYLDEDFNPTGQVGFMQEENKYITFHYHLNLSYQYQIPTAFPLNVNVTGLNGVPATQPAYGTFYALSRASFPSYSMQHLHDVVLSLRNDMVPLVYAYSIWKQFFSAQDVLNRYLSGVGFNAQEITLLTKDPLYGFNTWSHLKLWVISVWENNESDGAFDILSTHFHIPGLFSIVSPGSLLSELVSGVRSDMVGRYGSSDPVYLCSLQWAELGVVANMPLDAGMVTYKGLPTYLALNMTFNYMPEIQGVLLATGQKATSYLPIAESLLAPNYSYPMTNYHSLLNLNNIAELFTWYSNENYTSIVSL